MENRIKNLEKRIEKLERIINKSKIIKTRDDNWDELIKVIRIQKKINRIQA